MNVVKWQLKNSSLKLHVLCDSAKHAPSFVYEMVSRWLIPGQQVEVIYFSSRLVNKSRRMAVEVKLSSKEEIELALRALPFLEKEIRLGVASTYQAAKILEVRGLSYENKTVWIQEKILKLIRRFPKACDYDLITHMQQFLIRTNESFKNERSARHMTQMIHTLYHFQKRKERGEEICLKVKGEMVLTPLGRKKVVAIYLAIGGLKEHAIFEKRHLIKAVRNVATQMNVNENSYYEAGDHLFYIECEGEGTILRKALEEQIKGRIEHRVPSIFMPRNEEEVMRTLLVLGQQLKYVKDIPQMALHFNEQRERDLLFTITMACLGEAKAIVKLFQGEYFTIEKVKPIGLLRKKIPKQAVVIRAKIPREPFMREDYSVDLIAARFFLVSEVKKRIGEVRDYNGGIIAKQGENFAHLKKMLKEVGEKEDLFLQNVFHNFYPAHYTATCDVSLLKILFLFLLEAKEGISTKRADDILFVVVKQPYEIEWLEHLRKVPKLMTTAGDHWLGMIYLETEREKQNRLIEDHLAHPSLDI